MSQAKIIMRTYLVLLLTVLVVSCSSGDDPVVSTGGTVPVVIPLALNWIVASQREDGSELSLSDISSARIYYGSETKDYQKSIQIDYPISNLLLSEISLASGTYYFVITTVDTDGRESLYSSEVVHTI
jgi:fibronectin type 3 domain-containing protein